MELRFFVIYIFEIAWKPPPSLHVGAKLLLEKKTSSPIVTIEKK